MSLIHDALKSIDETAYAGREPEAHAASTARPSGRNAWVFALLAFVAVTGGGGLGWYLWQGQLHASGDPASSDAALRVVSDTSAPQAPAQSYVPVSAAASYIPEPYVAVAMDEKDHAPASPAKRADTMVRKTTAPVVAARAAKAAHKPVAHGDAIRSARPTASAKPVLAPAPLVEDVPVELLFARFVAAMRDGQTEGAENVLAALGRKLPAGSLGLLRAQAWFDLQSGRDHAAADIYSKILERLPGDEESAINLASIQSRQQKHEEARATLDASLRLQPDSAALRAALAQFTPNARQ
jgi:TolA-binding protein